MSDKKISVVLELKDNLSKGAKQSAASLKSFETASTKAGKSLNSVKKSSDDTNKSLSNVKKSAEQAGKGLDDIKKKSDKAYDSLKKIKDKPVKISLSDKVSQPLSRVSNQLKALPSSKLITVKTHVQNGLGGIKGAVGNGAKTMAMGLGASTLGILGLGMGVANTVKTFTDFDSQMSAVGAISGATGDEMLTLRDKAKAMGASTKFTATESGKAFEYMAMAGWKTSEMLGGIEGIMNLAAASGEDLGLVSDIVTDSMTAFGLQAQESGRFADVLAAASSNSNTNVALMGYTFKYVAPVAGALKYEVEDVASAIGLMANAGIKGEQAGTSLRGLLTRLVKPTKESGTAMDMLGISITDSQGKMKSFDTLIKDLRKSFAGLTEDQKAEYAAMMAGQEGMSGLLAIVNASEADYKKLTDAIDESSGAAKKMSEIRMDNLGGDITKLQSAWEGFQLALMDSAGMDGVRGFVQGITKLLSDFTTNLETNQNAFVAFRDTLLEGFGMIWEKFTKFDGMGSALAGLAIAGGAFGAYKGGKKVAGMFGIGKGKSGAAGVGGDLFGGQLDDMTINAMTVMINTNSLLGGGQTPVGAGATKGKGGVKGASTGARGRMGALSRGAGGLGLGGLGRGLAKIGGKVAIPLSLAMGAYELTTSDDKARAGTGLGGSLAGGLAGAKVGAMGGAALGSIIPGVGTAVGAGLGGLLGGIGGAVFGEEIANQIYDGITNNLEGITDWFSAKWAGLVEACTPAINTIVGLGAMLWDSLATLLGPAAEWFNANVWGPIQDFAGVAIDGVMSVFSSVWESVKGVWAVASGWFDSTVWQPIKSCADSAINSVTSVFSDAWESVKGVWGDAVGWFSANVWDPLSNKASEAMASMGSFFSSAQARGSQVTGLTVGQHATGTNHFSGGFTEINERGGEIVDLPNGSRIYPHATTKKMIADEIGGSSSSVPNLSVSGNTFVVREEADINKIAYAILSQYRMAVDNYGG